MTGKTVNKNLQIGWGLSLLIDNYFLFDTRENRIYILNNLKTMKMEELYIKFYLIKFIKIADLKNIFFLGYNNIMKKLLIVEDEVLQGQLLKEELEEEGYEVELVSSGKDALEKVEVTNFNCIILDIYLPGMDGLETMGRILSKNRQIPVILYSSYSSYQDNFLSWAADAYLIKSSDLTELKETIKRLVL